MRALNGRVQLEPDAGGGRKNWIRFLHAHFVGRLQLRNLEQRNELDRSWLRSDVKLRTL